MPAAPGMAVGAAGVGAFAGARPCLCVVRIDMKGDARLGKFFCDSAEQGVALGGVSATIVVRLLAASHVQRPVQLVCDAPAPAALNPLASGVGW